MDQLQQIAKELGIPLGHDIPTAAIEWIRKAQAELSRLRSAPVAVEVSREEMEILREGFGLMRTAWNTNALHDYQTVQAERIIQKYDAIRAGRPIPSDRVIEEGDVVASKDDLALLLQDACRYSGGADDAWDPDEVVRRLRVVRERNALRSSKEGA